MPGYDEISIVLGDPVRVREQRALFVCQIKFVGWNSHFYERRTHSRAEVAEKVVQELILAGRGPALGPAPQLPTNDLHAHVAQVPDLPP
jgi:hypothetical protein